MATNLRSYFPMIRTRQEIMSQIHSKEHLEDIYNRWTEAEQQLKALSQ